MDRFRTQRFAWQFLCLWGALTFAIALPVRAQSNAPPTNDASTNRQMHFRVLDADTGQPVAGVKVRSWAPATLDTDENGWCLIPLPQSRPGNFFYRILLSKNGYVGKYVTWSSARKDTLADMPPEYTANLEKGASIGGVVKNEQGQPVAGARILFSGAPEAAAEGRERSVVGPNYHVERTDDKGHWHYDEIPRHFQEFVFTVSGADFVTARFSCKEGGNTNFTLLPMDDYLSGHAAMTLGHGIVLSGLIVDSSGKPVAAAAIMRDRQWRNPSAELESGPDGRFRIENLTPGEMLLTVQASGLAGQSVLLTLSNAMPEVKITMRPGKIFRGRIVDEAGTPIAGAAVQMDRVYLGPLEYDWSTTTDADGRFLWDSAPEGEHPYYFFASGHHARSEPALVADGQDKLIVLRTAMNGDKTFVDGKVVDSTNGTPLEKYTLITHELRRTGSETNEESITNANGVYRAAVDSDAAAYNIEILADGFSPAFSGRRYPGDGDQRIDFKLEKGTAIAAQDDAATAPTNALKPGDIAPDFTVNTVDGKPLKLSDFRGKYVLLDFWATWCMPCIGEIPNLKTVYEAYGKNERFAMISLSLDDNVAQPRAYSRVNNMQWLQGFLGPWSDALAAKLFGVDAIPAIFLIGPDGKIVARDLRGEAIKGAVSHALGGN